MRGCFMWVRVDVTTGGDGDDGGDADGRGDRAGYVVGAGGEIGGCARARHGVEVEEVVGAADGGMQGDEGSRTRPDGEFVRGGGDRGDGKEGVIGAGKEIGRR